MADKELDKLVETIAARVRDRLGQSSICASCLAGASDCSACGECVVRREGDTRSIISLGAVRVASGPNVGPVSADLARYIDHTLLKPEATKEALRKLCEEAKKYKFYSVCINSANVKFCRGLLAGSEVKVVAVVGFPLGASSTGAKVFEAREAVKDGAEEVDMVINVGGLKSRNYLEVYEDIRRVVEAIHPRPVKVIIETGLLDQEEKVIASVLSKTAGARFVKTSTGFGPGGATAEDVALMKRVVGPGVEVKASGGVRDREGALEMIKAGATRIGASASIAIVTNQKPASSSKY
jgi:deoxyribose-phosphate aldolase